MKNLKEVQKKEMMSGEQVCSSSSFPISGALRSGECSKNDNDNGNNNFLRRIQKGAPFEEKAESTGAPTTATEGGSPKEGDALDPAEQAVLHTIYVQKGNFWREK